MPVRETGPRRAGSWPEVPFSGHVRAHTPARASAPVAMEGTGERDSLAEGRGFELSVPLARMSLDFRGGEGPSGRSEWSKQATRFHGGPAVRIPFAPPASPPLQVNFAAEGGEGRFPHG
jgi:hypothetical protein